MPAVDNRVRPPAGRAGPWSPSSRRSHPRSFKTAVPSLVWTKACGTAAPTAIRVVVIPLSIGSAIDRLIAVPTAAPLVMPRTSIVGLHVLDVVRQKPWRLPVVRNHQQLGCSPIAASAVISAQRVKSSQRAVTDDRIENGHLFVSWTLRTAVKLLHRVADRHGDY
jgi:hypothetical protein